MPNQVSSPPPRADKQLAMAGAVAHRIMHGHWQAGDRLPTVAEMRDQFGVALRTAQKSMTRLKNAKLIEATVGRGTFVAPVLPCLDRLALTFPTHPPGPEWSLFYEALSQATGSVSEQYSVNLHCYCDITQRANTPERRKLTAALMRFHFGGLICGCHPYELLGTPILDDPAIPKVAVMNGQWYLRPEMPAVYPDVTAFFRRALEALRQRGCRRPALVCHSKYPVSMFEHLLAELDGDDFEHEPWWLQSVPYETTPMAANSVLALLNPHQNRRPDALLVIDDHLVEPALRGVEQAGVALPEELECIAYCNFPGTLERRPHVRYLGFDAREVLSACVDQLRRLQRGEATTPLTHIPARFEDELTT